MKPESSLPHSQEPATRSYFSPVPRSLCMIRNMFKFLRQNVFNTPPKPKLEDHPLSAVRDGLFNFFLATLYICRPFLHPQPEDAACRGDMDPLDTVALSLLG